MANKTLFQSLIGALIPKTDAVNDAGGKAYALSPKHALAQYASTGCLNGTFYADAAEQLDTVLTLAKAVDPEFVAKVAVHARAVGNMKDLPALLLAILAVRDVALLKRVFARVCDNGKMVRTFVQILRSGVAGRKSLGTAPKKLVRAWMERLTDSQLLGATVGNDPSFADLVKMVHPKPTDAARRAFYAWLIGREHDAAALPAAVQHFDAWKRDRTLPIPDVPFQLLTSAPLDDATWVAIARQSPWQATRMNLNTFARHGVFKVEGMAELIAARLRDPVAIAKARVFPYQLMVAYRQVEAEVPAQVREALQDAMEIAIANVPAFAGQVVVCPDVSGSMQSAVTGERGSATSAVRCIDVAALVAAAVVRRNPRAEVIPFSDRVNEVRLNPRDSVMTNAKLLAELPSGGTDCSLPLVELNRRKAKADLVILVSDNESWIDAKPHARGTALLREWQIFSARNPGAKLVCLDLQPNRAVQAPERADILNIGGFADAVFATIAAFADGTLAADHWVGVIERMDI
ncbi:MAG: TROVE domain-containing protein [Planctomycetes bacterium]|nr:TROVE domain-containing protein [Planctomycetota bacterium]